MPASTDRSLFLIDVSSFIFRAFFAIRSLSTRSGEPTNAVYGVATMLARLIDEAQPKHLAVVYDSKEPSFRKEIYTDYKANRSAPPDELIPQFDRIEQLIGCMGIPSFRQSGVEADDIIATLARKWIRAHPDNRVTIVSGDKDLMQLVDERTCVWDTMKNEVYEVAGVEKKFGVRPDQIRDFLALTGDSSDNIPGVPSIGPKSAVTLLTEYQDLESILKAAADGKIAGKKGEVLRTHVEDARLSAELATLKEELELEPEEEKLRFKFVVSEPCLQLLKELDFHSLATKWGKYVDSPALIDESATEAAARVALEDTPFESPMSEATGSAPLTRTFSLPKVGPTTFRTILTEEAFRELLQGIEKAGWFGFDTETTSLNPREAELVGIAICYDLEFACYIPLQHRATSEAQLPMELVLEGLRPFLENPRYGKIGQNLKYDWHVMMSQGVHPRGVLADTMIAAYVLEPENRHGLDALAAKYFSYAMLTYEEVCGKGKDQIGFDLVSISEATRYSAEDAWITVHLWNALKTLLEEEGLMDVYRSIDLPLVEVLARMESRGVCIDAEWFKMLADEFAGQLKSIEERIGAYTRGPVNLNSPKQLATLLFEELKLPVQSKTKTGYSTDASVLEALAPLHEVPKLLREYREISKLKGTYVDPLPLMRDKKTGKIHAKFNQTVAATGRLSGSDPNLQNIPIRTEQGRKIRRGFVPSEGRVLLSADYSQIELRLLAHMSEDPDLMKSFQTGEDVHRRTASEIFEVSPDAVDDHQRSIAKAINFGLMYGKTAFALAQELKISRREAQETIDRYFARYSGVKRFLDQQILDAKEKGYVLTLSGRKRHLPDIRARNPAVRNAAERMAMNTPIQGTAADLMKLAMIEIDRRIEADSLESKLIIQVHDEVVLDCVPEELEAVRKMVCNVMENAMQLKVPLSVNTGSGSNWMEL